MTAPNGSSQRRLLATVQLERREGHTKDGALEAHGTGTALGDPIEVGAAVGALCAGRACDRERVASVICGSLKANLGHLEAAAAAAGLKAITALRVSRGCVGPNGLLVKLNVHLGTLVSAPMRDGFSCYLCLTTEQVPAPDNATGRLCNAPESIT